MQSIKTEEDIIKNTVSKYTLKKLQEQEKSKMEN